MVTIENMKDIFFRLINDEDFCRLLVYGVNPLDEQKENISNKDMTDEEVESFKNFMKEKIKFSPQISDLQEKQENRILIYKRFTKLKGKEKVIRDNTIQIDIFVPHYLMDLDFRTYLLEDKLSEILDGIQLKGLGKLDYVNGEFSNSPVQGFSFFSMTFSTGEGRNVYGKQ